MTLPVVFFGHGSPMNAIEDNRYTRLWKAMGDKLPRPRAVLAVSAHWYTRGTGVTAGERQKTIHDFGGFPQALFDIEYSTPGDPVLARRVQELLSPIPVHADESWGLDHGTWSVLMHTYPEADIPVLQLSIDATQAPAWHLAIGARLAPLRDEGVLVAGFGNVVHNLQRMKRADDAPPYEWAQNFERFCKEALLAGDHHALADYGRLGEDAALSVPTAEHYLPLLYVAGAKAGDEPVTLLAEGIEHGSLSMLCVQIGA